MKHLVIDTITKDYYWLIDNKEMLCTNCEAPIKETFVHVLVWFKHDVLIHHYCEKCGNKHRRMGFQEEYRIVKLSTVYKPSFMPILLDFPALKTCKDVSVFDASSDMVAPSERVVDNTRLAGRESWHGANIGLDMDKIAETRDRNLLEGSAYLDKLARLESPEDSKKKRLRVV